MFFPFAFILNNVSPFSAFTVLVFSLLPVESNCGTVILKSSSFPSDFDFFAKLFNSTIVLAEVSIESSPCTVISPLNGLEIESTTPIDVFEFISFSACSICYSTAIAISS